jgi:sigma-B regulation protein RsbU (phosphoserine phosphatase)
MTAPEAGRRTHELSTLNAIAETLNSALDLPSALEAALARLVERLEVDAGWIFLTRDEPGQGGVEQIFYPAATYGLPPALEQRDEAELRYQECECQQLFTSGRFEQAVNIVHCSRLRRAAGDTRGLHYHASVPLVSQGRLFGILNVAGHSRETFDRADLELLSAAGYQIGLAAERARLYELIRTRRFEEQHALLTLSNALLRAHDLQEILDQVVRVAAEVLTAEGGAIILETEPGRPRFAAVIGRSPETASSWTGSLSTDRGPAGWVLRHGEPLVVADLAADPRWAHPLLAEQEGFVTAALVPLFEHGRPVGVLAVYTRQPRGFDEDDMRLLVLMGNQVALAIEQEHLHLQALEEQRLRRELELAREIQMSFLPDACPLLPGWSICGYYQAAREIGGDFYDFVTLPPRRAGGPANLGLVIADVADKGVPAALFMALCRALVRAATSGGDPPQVAIARANALILGNASSDLFVTLFYGMLDPSDGTLRYVIAGHNPPLWWRAAQGRVQRLPGRGIALGVLDMPLLEEQQVTLEPGDALLLYTDGLTEAMDATGQEFGEARVAELLGAHASEGADPVMHAVVDAQQAFTGGLPAFDDVTLVIVQRRPNGGRPNGGRPGEPAA